MNNIRQIQALNKRELEAGVSTSGSWHADFRDSAFIYIGGLPFTLTEGDIVTIFSQFGEPVYINLVRDQETGKSKGFAFLKYEDQRSTDLAVDNLGGATLMGRILRVDHTNYKRKDDEAITDNTNGMGDNTEPQGESEESEEERPLIKEERELAELIRTHDDDDPMKQYLVQQKREEIEAALSRAKRSLKKSDRKERHQKHHHHRRERKEDPDEDRLSRSSRRGKEDRSQSPPLRRDRPRHHRRRRSSD